MIHEGATDYVDAGATALDTEDGDISDKITVTGVIDVKILGDQTLSFNVTDISDNPAVVIFVPSLLLILPHLFLL